MPKSSEGGVKGGVEGGVPPTPPYLNRLYLLAFPKKREEGRSFCFLQLT